MSLAVDIVNSNRALQQAITEQTTGDRPLPYVLAFRRQPINPTILFDTRLVNENNPLPSIVNIAFFVIKNRHSLPQEIDESLAKHYISACHRERKIYVIEARCELLKEYVRKENQDEFIEWRTYLLRDFPHATISDKLRQIMQNTPHIVEQMTQTEAIFTRCTPLSCSKWGIIQTLSFFGTLATPPPVVTILKILAAISLRNRQFRNYLNTSEKTTYSIAHGATFGSAIRFILDCTLFAYPTIYYRNIICGIANVFLSVFSEKHAATYARTRQREFEALEAVEVRL